MLRVQGRLPKSLLRWTWAASQPGNKEGKSVQSSSTWKVPEVKWCGTRWSHTALSVPEVTWWQRVKKWDTAGAEKVQAIWLDRVGIEEKETEADIWVLGLSIWMMLTFRNETYGRRNGSVGEYEASLRHVKSELFVGHEFRHVVRLVQGTARTQCGDLTSKNRYEHHQLRE